MPVGGKKIFSGEPLPTPIPRLKTPDPELDAFFRKIVDYLRRLSAKLDRFIEPPPGGGGGDVLIFAAYRDNDQIISDTVDTQVAWTTEIRKDSIYTHAANSATIVVLEAGFYVIELDVRMLKNVTVEIFVKINGSTVVYGYTQEAQTAPQCSSSLMVPVVLGVEDEVTIEMKSQTSAGDNVLFADGTRLLISRISEEETT